MPIEGLRDRARGQLHATLGFPANYYAAPRTPAAPLGITVRYHSGENKVGDLAGTNLSYAEVHDRAREVVFLVAEVPAPAVNSLVVKDAATGWVVKAVKPRDGITVKAEVVPATAAQLSGKLAPDGTVIP